MTVGDPKYTLLEVMAGDVTLISQMSSWSDDEFADIERSTTLVLSAAAVARALRLFDRGDATEEQARTWAEFMQRGCFDGNRPVPAEALWIDWDPEHEEAVVHAVMRLSELGDIIDGEFRPGEIDQLIAWLERPSR